MTPQQRRENYRQTRREARVAVLGWIVTLSWVVGVSWWLGTERPTALWAGIPLWALLGVGAGWLGTVTFNTWYAARILSQDGPESTAAPSASSERRGSR